VTVTGSGRCLSFEYQISSPRIELVVYKFQTGKSESSRVDGLKYTDQKNVGRWNSKEVVLNSDVEAIQLVAKKTGVTTNVEYVLVDVIGIGPCFVLGNVPVNVFPVSQSVYCSVRRWIYVRETARNFTVPFLA